MGMTKEEKQAVADIVLAAIGLVNAAEFNKLLPSNGAMGLEMVGACAERLKNAVDAAQNKQQ